LIIAFDGAPLVTRNITGIEQRARNIVTELSTGPAHHEFVLVLRQDMAEDREFDTSFIDHLPAHFRQMWWSPPLKFSGRLGQAFNRSLIPYSPADPSWSIFHSFGPTLPVLHGVCTSNTVHDLAYELDADVRRASGANRKRYHIRSAIRRSNLVVAVSRQTAADVQALFQLPSDRIATIPNGIDPIFTPVSDGSLRRQLQDKYRLPRRYALLVGSDIRRRNYRLVLEALAKVFPGEPALRVVFAGRQQWINSDLYRKAEAMCILDRCVFIESPGDEELAQLYRDATITICGSSFEGFGLSVLEAAACGCAVACSDMASLRELAEDAVVYFAHDDTESMAEAIKMLLDDVDYRKLLVVRGLKRAGLYSWRTAAQRLISAMENTVHMAESRAQV
jgi:alpha-1,3-rhamnosyl/mannosyltransferase